MLKPQTGDTPTFWGVWLQALRIEAFMVWGAWGAFGFN